MEDFQEGCHREIWSKILDCQNEYYFIDEDSIPRFTTMGTHSVYSLVFGFFSEALNDALSVSYKIDYINEKVFNNL